VFLLYDIFLFSFDHIETFYNQELYKLEDLLLEIFQLSQSLILLQLTELFQEDKYQFQHYHQQV
tara:strand:- start:2055 stop:2246 length:192 start_codon:yes stop_codon:yes gene_type:complete